MPGPLPLPVFDAAAAFVGDRLVVVGGVTQSLEATPAIQIRHPIYGWMPIGSNLLEPRGQPTLTRLPSGRWLALGGWSGTWGKNVTYHNGGETFDPLAAGSSRAIEPWNESLEGHTATPLPDGRVAVVCGCELRVYDEAGTWSSEVELVRPRHHHAVALVGQMLVIIGGDDEGTVESVLLGDEPLQSELWGERFSVPIADSSAIALDARFALVAGGADRRSDVTLNATWIIDAARRQIRPSLPLGFERGACDVALFAHPRGVIALGGEWRDGVARGAADIAMLMRPFEGEHRRWALPGNPRLAPFSRRVAIRAADGSFEVIGGYRFVAPDAADPNARAGVTVGDGGERLVVDANRVAD